MKDNTDCLSSYLYSALIKSRRKEVIARLVENIKAFGLDKFDTIVFRGMSGALIAPIVADELDKPMAFVRKGEREEDSHSLLEFEGNRHIQKYIIIDDLVFSGDTVRAIIKSVKSIRDTECVGIFCYRDARESNKFRPELDNTPETIFISRFYIN